jgi:triphosphoribosyl-dephospho-CoA synthase
MSHRGLPPPDISVLVQFACLLEASAPKPGNVSPGRPFEDARFEDYLLSAAAIGPVFARATDMGVGDLILKAVEETQRFVFKNTNLGIILLLGPLAKAATKKVGTLRERLSHVLGSLSYPDARAAHSAIRLANPAGLGEVEDQDVFDEPSMNLRETMGLAADRDTIAREYVTDYDVTFGLGAPVLKEARNSGFGWSEAVLETFLRILADVPDTLIFRKVGAAAAQKVSDRARAVLRAGPIGSPARTAEAADFDRELRSDGHKLNPGTTADLVAAALFVVLSEEL